MHTNYNIMRNYLPLISALVPTIALLIYIYWRDRHSPEPISQLLKATFFGVLSIPLSLCISQPFEWLGIYTNDPTTITQSIGIAFFGAAIPEELAKLCMLWLFLRRNKYFDERLDGIVYAVCVSLGFAGLENVLYVTQDVEWLLTAIGRAITAVPGHFCFAVAMGYFYSLVRFSLYHRKRNMVLLILTPILLHGIYDAILFITMTYLPTWVNAILLIVFGYFCFRMWKGANNAIKMHEFSDRFHALKFYDDQTEDEQPFTS